MDLLNSKLALDTIYNLIFSDSISFTDAASKYSDDDETKYNGGIIANPFKGNTRFKKDELAQFDQNMSFAVDKLKEGDITKPMPMSSRDGKQAYRILYLKMRTNPHVANLKDDYQEIQSIAKLKAQQDAIDEWINRRVKVNYIKIIPEYQSCNFSHNWNTK
jgi:peptidyl-prolyl cis-trans isomerase SurA